MGTDPLDDFGETPAERMRRLYPAQEVTPEVLERAMTLRWPAMVPVPVQQVDARRANGAQPTKEKPRKKARGAKGAEAERIVEAWLELEGWTVHRAAAAGMIRLPGGKTFVKSHDLFGCLDMVAFHLGKPETRGVQVTTASGKSNRRRKIELHRWPVHWEVLLVSHETTQDPANRRRNAHFLKVERYLGDRKWGETSAISIDMAAIEAHRKKKWAMKHEETDDL
jgi:hypothetical protein